jgi:hypothetical protein
LSFAMFWRTDVRIAVLSAGALGSPSMTRPVLLALP